MPNLLLKYLDDMEKWAFYIARKYRVALLLALVMVVVLAGNIWEKEKVSELGRSFSSIYADRLVPAGYIFEIQQYMYQKRELGVKWLASRNDAERTAVRDDIRRYDRQIEETLQAFGATFLVEKETELLAVFRQKYTDYHRAESVLFATGSADPAAFPTERFNGAVHALSALMQVQASVGREMRDHSRQALSGAFVFADLEIGILIIIAVMIQVLVLTRKSVSARQPRFRLN